MKTFIASLLFAAVYAQDAQTEDAAAATEERVAITRTWANADVTAEAGVFTSGGSLSLMPPMADGSDGSITADSTIAWTAEHDPSTRWSASNWWNVRVGEYSGEGGSCNVTQLVTAGSIPTVTSYNGVVVYRGQKDENPEVDDSTPMTVQTVDTVSTVTPVSVSTVEPLTYELWTTMPDKQTVEDMTAVCHGTRDVDHSDEHMGSAQWKLEGNTGFVGFTYMNTPPSGDYSIPEGGSTGSQWDVSFGSDSAAMLASASVAIAAVLSF